MRFWCAAPSVVAAVLAASNAAAQQPGSSGATRPNLRVLQSLPESQLFPLMNLLADSLGVRCDYCHVQVAPDLTKTPANVGGWVWDRDDKPAKRRAREMMQMVVDLNASRFGGQPRVSCYTCHRGAAAPSRLPPLPPRGDYTPTQPPSSLPSADRVWTNYLNAVGRAGVTPPDAAIIFRGWDDRSEGRFGKFEVALAGADRYHATLTTADGTATQGLNGDVAWVTAANGRVQRLSAADVARVRRIAMRYRAVKERPDNLQVVGIEHVDDRDVYVATASIDAVTTETMYFDVVTGLLRRDVITSETLLLPLQEQVDYDDYRDVNGVRMPFRIRSSDGAPYDNVTRTLTAIQRGVAIDVERFRPPADAR
jgi:hypothetical protein